MIIEGYQQFAGRHWETGAVFNVLAFLGAEAPHTGQPYSEAMLFGLANGPAIVVEHREGDFLLGTHWPFDAVGMVVRRLGIRQKNYMTSSPHAARSALNNVLEAGVPAIVWADRRYFDYAGLAAPGGMRPLVVYGVDEEVGAAYIADRAAVALAVSLEQLAEGRQAQKNYSHRLIQLDEPRLISFAGQIREAISACVSLYIEGPPKGPPSNYGLRALNRWTDNLFATSGRRAWVKAFPPGRLLFNTLVTITEQIRHYSVDGAADRALYADFLDEAAQVTGRVHLREAAPLFREAAALWVDFAEDLLPPGDDLWGAFPAFAEARALLAREHELFITRGGDSLEERNALRERLHMLMEDEFPLDTGYMEDFKAEMARHLRAILAAEEAAIGALQRYLEA